jgi:flagellar hook-associated protein 2
VSQASFATTDTAVASGTDQTFVYDYAGTEYSVDIADGTTLDGLVAAINNDANNPGIKASAFKVADGDYRLKLWGTDLGASNSLSVVTGAGKTNIDGFDGDGLVGGGAASDGFDISQTAQDAQLRVDGYPTATWISRSTNNINDVIDGLTLTLKSDSAGKDITLTTNTDTDAVKGKVQEFIDAVNEVRTKIIEISEVDDVTNKGAIFTGNYTVDIIDQKLKNITAGRGLGFDPDEDVYATLAQVGLKTDAQEGSDTYGLIILDEAVLDEVMANDPDAVARIFSAAYEGESTSPAFSYGSSVPGVTQAGVHAVDYTVDGAGDASGTIGGYAATWDAATRQLTGASGTPVAGLSIKVNNQTAGNYTGDVRIKLGKAGELIYELTELTRATTGPLAILEDSYNDTLGSIDEKIDYEQSRIDRMERDLKNRFARLDASLSYYNNIAASLSTQIAGMLQHS